MFFRGRCSIPAPTTKDSAAGNGEVSFCCYKRTTVCLFLSLKKGRSVCVCERERETETETETETEIPLNARKKSCS